MMTMAQSDSRVMVSRTGRVNQRWGSNGERLVAGIVPLSTDKYYVLLIQSTRRGGWVLPKGGWETDEPTAKEAACREAWEEAGVVVTVIGDLGTVPDHRLPEKITPQAPRAAYHFFEATVDRLAEQWPESHKRSRKWMSFSEAQQALADRPELLDALNRCTMHR